MKKKKKKWKLLIISGEKNNSYRTEMEFRIVSIRTGLEKKLHGTISRNLGGKKFLKITAIFRKTPDLYTKLVTYPTGRGKWNNIYIGRHVVLS